MFENDIKWVFPESVEEIYNNIIKEGNMIHAGGLTVNKLRPSSVKTLVDIQKAGLDRFEINDNKILIGAYLTVADLIKKVCNIKIESQLLNFLCDVFKNAGSTSIRNRITIGGSVVQFPAWSDIVPALVAVDAKLQIYCGEEKTVNILNFLTNRPESPFVLTSIEIDNHNISGFYRRLTNVDFDYPYMNFCALKKEDSVKCVLTGTKNKIEVFDIDDYQNKKIEFNDDMYFSAQYKKRLLDVYIREAKEELRV